MRSPERSGNSLPLRPKGLSRNKMNPSKLRYLTLAMVLFAFSHDCGAQTLSGTILDEQGSWLEAVSVAIRESGIHTQTGSDGRFIFPDLPGGRYTLDFMRTGLEKKSEVVELGDEGLAMTVRMRPNLLELPAVTVTAKPRPSAVGSTTQSLSIIDRRQISSSRGQSFGSILLNAPGVTILQSGPFGAKPAIRGLSFQRIVIQEEGLRHESQQWDEDDSPGIDPFNVTRLEIVRGPNCLLYGPNALGGVVNALTSEYEQPDDPVPSLGGIVALDGMTNNRQAAGNLSLAGRAGNAEYQGAATFRHAGDYSTPDGPVGNSGAREINGRGSFRFRDSLSDFSAGISSFNQKKYLPLLGEETGSPTPGPYQKTSHHQIRLRYLGRTHPTFLELHGGWQNNDAAEFEDSHSECPEIGQRLTSFQLNAKLHHSLTGDLSGTVGLSLENQRNRGYGEVAIIPDYDQFNFAAIIYEEAKLPNLILSAGSRFDYRELNSDANRGENVAGAGSRKYGAFSGSAGILWHVSAPVSISMNAGSGWRPPDPQELFVDGLEEGSTRYKTGDPGLGPEHSFGLDLSLRYHQPELQATITAYHQTISRYIYLGKTNLIDSASGYNRYLYRQSDAFLNGCELSSDMNLFGRLLASFSADAVFGKNGESGGWLPLLPPVRFVLAAKYQMPDHSLFSDSYLSVQSRILLAQHRTDLFETGSPGYALFDAGFGGTFRVAGSSINLNGTIENIFDRAYRDHLSLYRDYLLNPGINLIIRLSVPFTLAE